MRSTSVENEGGSEIRYVGRISMATWSAGRASSALVWRLRLRRGAPLPPPWARHRGKVVEQGIASLFPKTNIQRAWVDPVKGEHRRF